MEKIILVSNKELVRKTSSINLRFFAGSLIIVTVLLLVGPGISGYEITIGVNAETFLAGSVLIVIYVGLIIGIFQSLYAKKHPQPARLRIAFNADDLPNLAWMHFGSNPGNQYVRKNCHVTKVEILDSETYRDVHLKVECEGRIKHLHMKYLDESYNELIRLLGRAQ